MVDLHDPVDVEQQAKDLTELERAMRQQDAAFSLNWQDVYEIFAELASQIARRIEAR